MAARRGSALAMAVLLALVSLPRVQSADLDGPIWGVDGGVGRWTSPTDEIQLFSVDPPFADDPSFDFVLSSRTETPSASADILRRLYGIDLRYTQRLTILDVDDNATVICRDTPGCDPVYIDGDSNAELTVSATDPAKPASLRFSVGPDFGTLAADIVDTTGEIASDLVLGHLASRITDRLGRSLSEEEASNLKTKVEDALDGARGLLDTGLDLINSGQDPTEALREWRIKVESNIQQANIEGIFVDVIGDATGRVPGIAMITTLFKFESAFSSLRPSTAEGAKTTDTTLTYRPQVAPPDPVTCEVTHADVSRCVELSFAGSRARLVAAEYPDRSTPVSNWDYSEVILADAPGAAKPLCGNGGFKCAQVVEIYSAPFSSELPGGLWFFAGLSGSASEGFAGFSGPEGRYQEIELRTSLCDVTDRSAVGCTGDASLFTHGTPSGNRDRQTPMAAVELPPMVFSIGTAQAGKTYALKVTMTLYAISWAGKDSADWDLTRFLLRDITARVEW